MIKDNIVQALIECQSDSPSVKKRVGCVIANENGEIVARGCNTPKKSISQFAGDAYKKWSSDLHFRAVTEHKEDYFHAELNAFGDLPTNVFLDDKFVIYVTHEPCLVCEKHIKLNLPNAKIIVVDVDKPDLGNFDVEFDITDINVVVKDGVAKSVISPSYYMLPNGIECKDVSGHFMGNVAQAIQYLWRAGKKGDKIEDLEKAKKFIEFEIKRLEGVGNESDL